MEWKVIQGFENYEVSNTGEVRNIKRQRCLKPSSCKGYLRVVLINDLKKNSFFVHRLVALTFLENPKAVVDHIDGNITNNHVSNLRWASIQENLRNQKIPKNNKSGVKGVYLCKHNQRWKARIHVDGMKVHLGYFNDIEDARHARIAAVQKAFGVFAHASER